MPQTELRAHLEGLRRARDKKRQELRALQQELDALSAAISRFEGELAAEGHGETGPVPPLAGKGIVEAACEVLRSRKSLTTRELWDTIHEAGVQTTSEKPVATCYATLHNAKKAFVREGGRWSLRENLSLDR
jgi:hypothetical protein